MTVPNPGLIPHYKINLFTSKDAAKILGLSNKPSRVSPERAALIVNDAIRVCLARTGQAEASPAAEHARWAEQLAESLDKSLTLLGVTQTRGPTNHDLIGNYARLFDGGEPPSDLIAVDLKRYGFDTVMDALEQSTVGLWFLLGFAIHARRGWRKKRRTAHKDRRAPNPFMLAWAQSMIDLYPHLFDGQPPHKPAERSPFIRVCDGIRNKVIAAWGDDDLDGTSAMRRFMATLRGAEAQAMSAFICRNAKHLTWEQALTKQAHKAR
jgi:hypothetical protein